MASLLGSLLITTTLHPPIHPHPTPTPQANPLTLADLKVMCARSLAAEKAMGSSRVRAGFRTASLLVKYREAWTLSVAGAPMTTNKNWKRHLGGDGVGLCYSTYSAYEAMHRLGLLYPRFLHLDLEVSSFLLASARVYRFLGDTGPKREPHHRPAFWAQQV